MGIILKSEPQNYLQHGDTFCLFRCDLRRAAAVDDSSDRIDHVCRYRPAFLHFDLFSGDRGRYRNLNLGGQCMEMQLIVARSLQRIGAAMLVPGSVRRSAPFP
jgi:hypothetical protein